MTALESIKLPPTLKMIEKDTFRQCASLRMVEFSEGIEKIGITAFCESGLEKIELPSSLRELAQGAFAACDNLRQVKINEGLEVLGTEDCLDNGDLYYGVFQESALESVELP